MTTSPAWVMRLSGRASKRAFTVCGRPEAARDPFLIEEFEALAGRVAAHDPVLMHRDFQSQNIMVRDGSAWLVDLQGLRHGCMFYDFASLAFDPYLTRNDMDLWRIEIEDHAREVSGWKGSSDEFSHLFHVAATQRLLQACAPIPARSCTWWSRSAFRLTMRACAAPASTIMSSQRCECTRTGALSSPM